MDEPTTPANAPAANASDTPALAATNTPNAQAADGQEPITLEEARRLRSEQQALRKRLKAYEDAEEQAKAAALSEVEKATKRASDLEAKLKQQQQQLVNARIALAAKEKGIIDPDLAALAIASTLEFDDDGMPSNLDKALDALLAAKPYLKAAEGGTRTAPVTSANNPGRANTLQPGALPPNTKITLGDLYSTYKK